MEVLIATALAGMVITGAFRLIAMSVRLLGVADSELSLVNAGEYIWLSLRADPDMPEAGTDDDMGISWESEKVSIPVEDYELNYRRVTVKDGSGGSITIYVGE